MELFNVNVLIVEMAIAAVIIAAVFFAPQAAEFIRAFLSCEVTASAGKAATKKEMSND